MDITLVVMAAGMGSRFGGLKQLEPVGLSGESIADFSVYDARKAGFNKVVFVIKKEIEEVFRESVFDRIANCMDAEYVFQEIEDIPKGFDPSNRVKPWGTGHAVICCRNTVKGNFTVLNADDFYGYKSFAHFYKFLADPNNHPDTFHYCMVGYELDKTLTENGTVARGLCAVDENGYLTGIDELIKIEPAGGKIINTYDDSTIRELQPKDIVSMNAWGFTQKIFDQLDEGFLDFLKNNLTNPKAEYYLPVAVGGILLKKTAKVKVLPCDEKWYGFTYKGDLDIVKAAIREMIKEGKYPENLWAN